MRRLFLSFLVLTLTLPAIAQAKHPFTFEDMMKLKRVGDPQVSPDGKWVIFSVVDVDLAANTKTPHVWIVPLNADSHVSQNHGDMGHPDSTERELMPEQDADRPRWSPDGKRFAFLSNKTNGSQVWIADFDPETGKVVGKSQLTTTVTEAGGELWSPDGKSILFTSEVYPQCDGLPNEIACNFTKHAEENRSKVKAQIFDHLLYRHWNAYKEGTRTHLFLANIRSAGNPKCVNVPDQPCSNRQYFATAYRDLTPGDYDAPVFSLGGQDDYAFSPDGQEICYASNHDKNPAASTNNDLWIVPVDGGADASSGPTSDAARELTPHDWVKTVLAHTKNITADNPASDTSPLYSPDGKYIAYRAQQRPGDESDRFRLMLYDRKTGDRKNLTEDFDGWVGTYAWSPDSRKVYFVYQTTGSSPIAYLDINAAISGMPKKGATLTFGYNDDVVVIPHSENLLSTQMSIRAPNEIYRSGTERVSSRDQISGEPLTHLNDVLLSQVDMPKWEVFWFKGARRDDVEGFLVKPPNFDPNKKYPVKFLIHGGPEGAWGDDWSYRWNPELFAANGYVVIMINFHGSTGYGQKFVDAINGDWGGAPFEDLMKGLDYAEQHYPFIDKDRECALGASYGGYMANWILGHTNRFKCIVSHDGTFNTTSAWGTTEELWFNEWEFNGTPYTNRAMYDKWSPHLSATNFKTPTLVVHGQLDYRLDVSEGFQLFTTLQRLGVPSKMLYFPDEGHWVLKPQNSQLWYKTVNNWVDQWTKTNAYTK